MNDSSASATSRPNHGTGPSRQFQPLIGDPPYVNVSFPLSGRQLPADHGYLLYSAIARATQRVSASGTGVSSGTGVPPVSAGLSSAPGVPHVSALHKAPWLAIELISGFPSAQGLIALPDRSATLRLRIPADHYRDVLPLAGKRLDIGGHQIRRRLLRRHSDKVGGYVMFVQRLSAIIELRDLPRLTSHKNIPIAQRLRRRISKYLVSRVLVKEKSVDVGRLL